MSLGVDGDQGRSRDRAALVGYLESRNACKMVEVQVQERKNFTLEENPETEEQLRQNCAVFARKVPTHAIIIRCRASKLRIANDIPLKLTLPVGAKTMNQSLLFSNPNHKDGLILAHGSINLEPVEKASTRTRKRKVLVSVAAPKISCEIDDTTSNEGEEEGELLC